MIPQEIKDKIEDEIETKDVSPLSGPDAFAWASFGYNLADKEIDLLNSKLEFAQKGGFAEQEKLLLETQITALKRMDELNKQEIERLKALIHAANITGEPISTTAYPLTQADSEDEFMPPDNGDICWDIGSETFTRKEVAYLLYTQRSMISNDIKRNVLTADQNSRVFLDVLNVLKNIRSPKY